MGCGSFASTPMNRPSSTAPAASGTSTDTDPHPYEDAAISP